VHAPPRLPAARTDPSTATQANRHDHPLNGEAHIDDRGAGQAQAEQWKAADSEGRLLPHSHLRSLTLDQMGDLHQTHKDLLFRSMESLKPAAA
jgi:hypothetical protein